MEHVFVYGTLLPGEVRWHHLAPFVIGDGVGDSVDGTLYDTGVGYPAARFGTGSTVHGQTFALRADTAVDALRLLDEVEGAVEGLYVRRSITTHRGITVWAYEYGHGLTLTAIAHGSWLAHRQRP